MDPVTASKASTLPMTARMQPSQISPNIPSYDATTSYVVSNRWMNFKNEDDDDSDENLDRLPQQSKRTRKRTDRTEDDDESGDIGSTTTDDHLNDLDHSQETGALSASHVTDDGECMGLLDATDGASETSEPYSVDEDPYSINEEQRKYYMECFEYLLKKAQTTHEGTSLHSGAIRGADPAVQDFFGKSKLGREQLRQIWTLADVNQDGWLNANEFALAMHLCVMHIKGGVPLPEYLPAHVHIPSTPPRSSPPTTIIQHTLQRSPPNTPRNIWRLEKKSLENNVKMQNENADENKSPQLPYFQKAPPNKVEKPIPIVAQDRRTKELADNGGLAAILSPNVPKGPPPAPPPRPAKSNHIRSASLDLNAPQNSLAPKTTTTQNQGSHGVIVTTAIMNSGLPKTPHIAPVSASTSHHTFLAKTTELNEVHTQTEFDLVDLAPKREPQNVDFDVLANAKVSVLEQHTDRVYSQDWRGKCARLRRENAELEAERARLVQIRIQLEMRLESLKKQYHH